MRLAVFFLPFTVKGLTEFKSAAERFKVSSQGGLHGPWQWAFPCLQPLGVPPEWGMVVGGGCGQG